MSVNETTTHNVWEHHFPDLVGRGGVLWDKLDLRGTVVEIATLYDLMKMIDSSLPPVTHIWVTLSDLFTHFTIKSTERMVFKKNS
jgi:hypothetical protein